MKDLPVQGKIMLFIILWIIVYTIRDFIKWLHLKREEEPYQEFEDTDRDEESY